jgi:hypothetical protein
MLKISRNRTLVDKETHILIVPDEPRAVTPLACPVCETLFRNIDDEMSWEKMSCCSACADEWAYPNRVKWLNGWRPNSDAVREVCAKRHCATLRVNR